MAEFFDILDEVVIGAKLLEQWELPESVFIRSLKINTCPSFMLQTTLIQSIKPI